MVFTRKIVVCPLDLKGKPASDPRLFPSRERGLGSKNLRGASYSPGIWGTIIIGK